MGPHVAENILASIDARPLRPFEYAMAGQMANLGGHQAVAMLGGVQLAGFPAWWLWRTYYLSRLPTLERKIRVAIDWTLDLFFPRDIVKLSPWGPPRDDAIGPKGPGAAS
jgi:NADH dehydrogenase